MSTPRQHLSNALARNRQRRQYRREERAYRRVVDSIGSDSAARELSVIWATRR
jgi:hypothetical protein